MDSNNYFSNLQITGRSNESITTLLASRDNEIALAFHSLIEEDLQKFPQRWWVSLVRFKWYFEQIQEKAVGAFTSTKIIFSWDTLDQIVKRDYDQIVNQVNLRINEPEIGIALRKLAQTNAALEKNFLERIICEYRFHYYSRPQKRTIQEVLLSKNSFSWNTLHLFVINAIKEKKIFSANFTTWETYWNIVMVCPGIDSEKDHLNRTALQIVEQEESTSHILVPAFITNSFLVNNN